MKCNMCHKELVRPLELYDGSWACPHCRREINLPELNITAENNDMYAMSELYYSEWLTNSGELSRDGRREARGDEGRNYLNTAIKLCRQSAEKGNPYAIIRLAYYYDKDYVELNYTETMRCKIAYKYYSYVCFYEREIKNYKEETDARKFDDMKRRAARLMLEMLAYAPEDMTKSSKYKPENVRRKVVNSGILSDSEINLQSNSVNDATGAETAMKVLESCFSKYRAPLFCVLRLSGRDFKQIMGTPEWSRRFIRTAMGGVDLYYIGCKRDGAAEDGFFTKLSNDRNIKDSIEDMKDSGIYRLVILNGEGKHRFFPAPARNRIFRFLADNYRGEPLRAIIDCNRDADCVFFDDDVYIFKDRRSYSGAVNCLIDKLGRVDE